jgi:hypothetical protein
MGRPNGKHEVDRCDRFDTEATSLSVLVSQIDPLTASTSKGSRGKLRLVNFDLQPLTHTQTYTRSKSDRAPGKR